MTNCRSRSPLDSIGKPAVLRMIRRPELRWLVPLADSTIYEMEQRGEFPQRFNLSTFPRHKSRNPRVQVGPGVRLGKWR